MSEHGLFDLPEGFFDHFQPPTEVVGSTEEVGSEGSKEWPQWIKWVAVGSAVVVVVGASAVAKNYLLAPNQGREVPVSAGEVALPSPVPSPEVQPEVDPVAILIPGVNGEVPAEVGKPVAIVGKKNGQPWSVYAFEVGKAEEVIAQVKESQSVLDLGISKIGGWQAIQLDDGRTGWIDEAALYRGQHPALK